MISSIRSISGAVLMLMIIPVVEGLLACMPVPIGNPERSRIDPEISGMWVSEGESEIDLYLFQPYDKRTWLTVTIGRDKVDTAAIYKVWLTKLGGERFMTFEPVAGVNDDGTFTPEYWFNMRFRKLSAEHFELDLLDGEHAAFEGIEETRRAYERAIRKHVSDESLYSETIRFSKAPPEGVGEYAGLFKQIITFE
jgi:hypothetical protein